MNRLLKQNKYIKYFSCFLSIYMLNLSIDVTDNINSSASNNLSLNDQESIIEVVLEKVLGFENVITEKDISDTDKSFALKKHKILEYIITIKLQSKIFSVVSLPAKANTIYQFPSIKDPSLSILYPPPKA